MGFYSSQEKAKLGLQAIELFNCSRQSQVRKMVATLAPRRPPGGRQPSGVSPRQLVSNARVAAAAGGRGKQKGIAPGITRCFGTGATDKLNKKSIERLRNAGFPRANIWDFGAQQAYSSRVALPPKTIISTA